MPNGKTFQMPLHVFTFHTYIWLNSDNCLIQTICASKLWPGLAAVSTKSSNACLVFQAQPVFEALLVFEDIR